MPKGVLNMTVLNRDPVRAVYTQNVGSKSQ